MDRTTPRVIKGCPESKKQKSPAGRPVGGNKAVGPGLKKVLLRQCGVISQHMSHNEFRKDNVGRDKGGEQPGSYFIKDRKYYALVAADRKSGGGGKKRNLRRNIRVA